MIAENFSQFWNLPEGERRSLQRCRDIRDQIEDSIVQSVYNRYRASGDKVTTEVGFNFSHEMAKDCCESIITYGSGSLDAKKKLTAFFESKKTHKKKPLERLLFFFDLCERCRLLEMDAANMFLTKEQREIISK